MPRKTLITAAPDATGGWQDARDAQLPQTETGIAENTVEEPGIPAGDDSNLTPAQTETELAEFDAGLQADSPEFMPEPQAEAAPGSDVHVNVASNDKNSDSLHTGSENDEDGGTSGSAEAPDGEFPQTGSETDGDATGSVAQGPNHPGTAPDSQTGSESSEAPEKKPRRRSAKSQSGESDESQSASEPKSAARPARRRTRVEPVLAIDEQRSVETQQDKLRNDLLDLVESQKGRKILAGTIQGVERSADNPNISFAVIYHGAFKIIIPAEETVQPPDDFRDRSPADVMHYLVTKRLGAEVDYIVKGVDINSGIAAASRLDAMALKRRQYYFGSDRDGNNLIYEGLSAEARVVSVIRAGIFVDLFGLETYIPLRELSYQRWIDAAAHLQPGQRVLVKILKLDRSDRNNIRVAASVKQAGENPYEQALKRYTPGSRYVGTVSMVDTNGVFVSLDGGIDCLCTYPKRGRPPRGARVTVRIIGVNHENNRIWGAITHMTTAR